MRQKWGPKRWTHFFTEGQKNRIPTEIRYTKKSYDNRGGVSKPKPHDNGGGGVSKPKPHDNGGGGGSQNLNPTGGGGLKT